MLSRATISRLPDYLAYLRELGGGAKTISASAIAKGLSLGDVQVRKDLAAVCGNGKPKTGYSVTCLLTAIENALGVNAKSEAVIVGAGKLGMALLAFPGFSDFGLTVQCAFDTNPDVLSPRVLPMARLPDYCTQHKVGIGIVTVPPESAQEATDALVACGVKAIWCFASRKLSVPPGIIVQYENLALSLAHVKSKAHPMERTEEQG